ncbi:hypothetical protein QZH41_005328 [Actinostola sp. cb2023]|nr:hypothetical protein QZH41_005328 [Actinostola sp. cb2023]
MPDFATMYADIDAVLDSPPCLVWDEILRCFPDAKVIIQERDNVDVWLKSFLESSKASKTTQNQWWVFLGFAVTPSGRKWKRLIDLERLSYRNMDTKFLLELYTNCHNARVKALVPRDKLLVYNIKQGWEPLCEFLGVQDALLQHVRRTGTKHLANQQRFTPHVPTASKPCPLAIPDTVTTHSHKYRIWKRYSDLRASFEERGTLNFLAGELEDPSAITYADE